MINGVLQFAFIGPGGPEFFVVVLVLLMLFGAKDAPRILRQLSHLLSRLRNTAEGFRQEIMYGDVNPEILAEGDEPGMDVVPLAKDDDEEEDDAESV